MDRVEMARASETAVLDVEHLSKAFGRGAAIRGVSFQLFKGEVVSLLGPSGCGKTTTLRCIAGFYRPDAGRISINGRLVASTDAFVAPEDRRIAMVFQNYVLWPHMTAFDNIAYGLKLRRVVKTELRARVADIMQMLGLAGLEKRYPHQLSGGQQQRVSVARSLVVRPEVLLLDEPFSNLDAKLRVQMRQEMRDVLQRLDVSAIYVTHDQEEAMVLSDRILLMDGGDVVEEGGPSDLFERPRTRFAASFFGVVNFLPGTVKTERGSLAFALDAVNVSVPLPAGTAARPGDHRVLGLRQDAFDIRPCPQAESAADIIGRVKSCYYVGGATELIIEGPNGLEFRCKSSDHCSIASGDRVSIRIRPQGAILLAKAAE
jgi:ABC-type Fe3+/spermidine/putrescine transport system ATPase subunit